MLPKEHGSEIFRPLENFDRPTDRPADTDRPGHREVSLGIIHNVNCCARYVRNEQKDLLKIRPMLQMWKNRELEKKSIKMGKKVLVQGGKR